MDAITSFQGEHLFLSNFWFCPVLYLGDKFTSAEHAYQAAKCALDEDYRRMLPIKLAVQAKRMGKKVKLRDDWDNRKLGVMRRIVWIKFTDNSLLRDSLLGTGDADLIESNTWSDRYWGVCGGVGENHLGRILMEFRRTFAQNV